MSAIPDWLPDWRDAGQYPADDAPLDAWRWEFLRRNADYWADFARLQCREITIQGIEDRWLLPLGPDPSLPFNESISFSDVRFITSGSLPDIQDELAPLRYIAARIDTHKPLGPQLKMIERAAKGVQRLHIEAGSITEKEAKETKYKSAPGLYRRYLRIWDGKLAGASDIEIAKALLPDILEEKGYDSARQAVKAGHRAAKRLIEEDYRYMVDMG